MTNIDELIELNFQDPISRYLTVAGGENEVVRELTIKILFSLKAIDDTLQRNCNTSYHFYIKDDMTIYNLLSKVYNKGRIEKSDFNKAMFILDFCKLIYRFTCAKKFKEKNLDIFQLRLNSWGREYIESYIRSENTDYNITKRYLDLYCENNNKTYIELTRLLLGDLRDEEILAIDKLNSILDIKLLS